MHHIPNAVHSECTAFRMHRIPNVPHSECTTIPLHCIPNARILNAPHSNCTAFWMHRNPIALHSECTAFPLHCILNAPQSPCTAFWMHRIPITPQFWSYMSCRTLGVIVVIERNFLFVHLRRQQRLRFWNIKNIDVWKEKLYSAWENTWIRSLWRQHHR